MLMPLGIGSGSPSNNIGKTMTTASTKATAPVKRRLALTRNEAAWASLETEGLGLAACRRVEPASFLENKPMT